MALWFIIVFITILPLASNGKPVSDENLQKCYPKDGLDWPADVTTLKEGGEEIWRLMKGGEPDGDSFKKVAFGYLSWVKIGLQIASAEPTTGQAAGAILGLIDRLSPKQSSTELECMQVMLDVLKEMQTKLNSIHDDVKHIVDLMKGMTSQMTYAILRANRMTDQSVLEHYASKSASKRDAIHACKDIPPYAIRESILKLVNEPSLGIDFIPTLVNTANCDEVMYAKFVTVVMTDVLQLTVLDKICSQVRNESELFANRQKRAAKHISAINMALLAGRFDLQKKCLEKAAKDNFKDLIGKTGQCANDGAKAYTFAASLNQKFPLLKTKRILMCAESGENFGGWYCENDAFSEDQCPRVKYDFTQNDMTHKVRIPVPQNSTQAAIEFMQRQGQDCDNPSAVCWNCKKTGFNGLAKCIEEDSEEWPRPPRRNNLIG